MELGRDERSYENLHMQSLGPLHLALKNISKNYCYSESYEIHALCNVLECNIRSFCPSIGMHPAILAMLNKVFTPMASRNVKCTVTILWSHANVEMDAKAMNHGNWSPNHFVPLLSSGRSARSDDDSSSPSMKVYRIDELSVVINFEFRLLRRERSRTTIPAQFEYRSSNHLQINVGVLIIFSLTV